MILKKCEKENLNLGVYDQAFEMVKGDLNPQFTKKRTLKLSERPEFEKFLSKMYLLI